MAENTTTEDAKLEIERQKLGLERQKLEIEQRKFDLEEKKAWWTSISIAVPVLIVAGTIWAGMNNSEIQAKQAFRLEAAKAIVAPELEADRVVRASILREVFSAELGTDFAKTFDFKRAPDAADITPKLDFMKLVSARGLSPEETAQLFFALFPADKKWWTLEVQAILASNSRRTATK